MNDVDVITVQKFRCAKCRTVYDTQANAERCASRPISQDRGVKVGDVVRITRGDGTGLLAKVDHVMVFNQAWGRYAWDRYWHTVGLSAKLIDHPGSRTLTFDHYEVLP